ncbi:DUF4383 domain-containing protein [Thermomonospora umbrina]|uniref:Uncharacterized protein DUF4383 n=1 Tax=Thermomonospora umbrina TaxID=111806 RepID=A0A3D9SL55_9ACTN|nr:DUF4383 domain-containing protein [Thermomonospora umbrina]REE96447.1 uncharacterized protein DUF4383 [Thermomonospora umbrina]
MAHSAHTQQTGAQTKRPNAVRLAAYVVGAVFLLVAVLGFIPGVTSNYDSMEWAGHESGAKLFGLFQVSILHNLVHGLFGVLGLALARTTPGARGFLLGGGLIYLLLWLYGLFVDHDSGANFVPLNHADNWLHLGLGLGMMALSALPQGRAGAPGRHSTEAHPRDTRD